MDHHQKTGSTDIFSFPSTPSQDQDSDFEFGCLTPDSPSGGDPYKTSPADHLFYNGRLLPHSFPLQQQQQQQTPIVLSDNLSNTFRASSRTSSISSKDSLMSSRSNSVNSSRSSVSSRTSWSSTTSDNSERKLLYYSARIGSRSLSSTPMASKVVMAQLYGSSQRWQHIMPTPAPAMKRENSRRTNGGFLVKQQGLMKNKKESDHQERKKNKKYGICRRFFRSFLVACRECHAMEPSIEDDILQGNVKIR